MASFSLITAAAGRRTTGLLRLARIAALIPLPGLAAAQEPPTPPPSPAPANDSAYVLPPVEVSVERDLAAAPPVVTLNVDPTELRRTQAANPYDLLRRVTGVEVHDHGQGPGFAPNVVIRGFTSDHSSDVLLTIDGVPINLPVHGHQEGYADWYLLMPGAVSTLRVLHGTASPLYGDFALGGVVEVFTAADGEGTAWSAAGSSERDVAGWVRSGFRHERGGGLAALDVRRTQGWRDNADSWLGNGLLRGWRGLGAGRLEAGLQVYASGWNSPGFLSIERFNDGDLEDPVDPSDGGSARRAILHGRYAALLGSTAVEATAWAQGSTSETFLNVPEGEPEIRQTDEEDSRLGAGGQVQLSWSPPAGELTLGVSGRSETADYELLETEERERVATEKAFDAGYLAGGTFARWRRTVLGRLGLDLGGRVDALRYSSRDRLEEDAETESATHVVAGPKLGARYRLGYSTALLASLSRGFRGAPGVIEDPDLPPLEAWSAEVGGETSVGRLQARVAAFRLDVSNERIQDPVTREIANVGGSIRQGVDVLGRVRVTPAVWLSGAATLNDARISDDADDPADSESAAGVGATLAAAGRGRGTGASTAHLIPLQPGDRVPGVARYTGRVQVEATVRDRTTARATWRFLGPYVPIGEPDVRTQPHGVLDVGVTLPWGDAGLELDLELQNAFDTKYPEIRSSGFVSPGAPRTLVAGIRSVL